MSFDIWMQDIPVNAKTLDDISDDFEPKTIGSRKEIAQKIVEVAPETVFITPRHAEIETNEFSIDIWLDDADEIYCCHFSINGEVRSALPTVARILKCCGYRALMPGEIGIFDRQEHDNFLG